MYEARLGDRRARSANPWGSMLAHGVPLALGSDSPVTPFDPWATVRAAVGHHQPSERLEVATALEAHTAGGWAAAREDGGGRLVPDAAATFSVWDAPALGDDGLPEVGPDVPLPTCRLTVRDGITLFCA